MNIFIGAKTLCKCIFGAAPVPINNIPTNKSLIRTDVAFNILDNKPMVNIPSFGTCMSIANPMVAAATAAAMGVLTPMPCIPNIIAPWIPLKPTVILSSAPIVNSNAMLMCMWGGMIKPVVPDQFTTLS